MMTSIASIPIFLLEHIQLNLHLLQCKTARSFFLQKRRTNNTKSTCENQIQEIISKGWEWSYATSQGFRNSWISACGIDLKERCWSWVHVSAAIELLSVRFHCSLSWSGYQQFCGTYLLLQETSCRRWLIHPYLEQVISRCERLEPDS